MTSSMETDFMQGHPERSYQHELLIWQQNEIRKLKLTKEWKTRNGVKGDDFNVPLLKSQSPLPPKRLNRREKQDLCKVTSIQLHQVVHLLSTFLGRGAKDLRGRVLLEIRTFFVNLTRPMDLRNEACGFSKACLRTSQV